MNQPPDPIAIFQANLVQIRQRMAETASRAGRLPEEIRLIGVTKYVDASLTQMVLEAGCLDLGESRPQQLCEKAALLKEAPLCWHLIGHLQRNKVKRTVAVADWIHSVDSLRLLQTIDRESQQQGRPINVLLEVNISGDVSKQGLAMNEVETFLPEAAACQHVSIRGLMGMGSREGGVEAARQQFASLRELRDRLRQNAPDSISLDELSMGMSGDFEIAIEEGSTMVRIGSILFEGLPR